MNYVLEAAARISSVPVGMYDAVKRQYRAYERTIMWPGNTAKVPADFFSGALFCSLHHDMVELSCCNAT